MTRERAAEICQYIKFILKNEDYTEEVEEALDMAIIALDQEPKRGKWIRQGREIDGNYRYMCSECEHIDIQAEKQEVPYCWYCGARMESDTQ